MTIIASYFDINTYSAAQSIFRFFFNVSNLIGVDFSDAFRKPVKVPDFDSRPVDITYFIFRSNVSAVIVDCCASKKLISPQFHLRLPQFLSNFHLTIVLMLYPVKPFPHFVADLEFALGNRSNEIIAGKEPEQMRSLLTTTRDTNVPAFPTPTLFAVSFNLFFISTPSPLRYTTFFNHSKN